nr:14944_t:CDS:2 [Entrophospora candida]
MLDTFHDFTTEYNRRKTIRFLSRGARGIIETVNNSFSNIVSDKISDQENMEKLVKESLNSNGEWIVGSDRKNIYELVKKWKSEVLIMRQFSISNVDTQKFNH